MRLEFSNSCFFPRVLLRKGNIVFLSAAASFSRLFRTLIFFRPQRLRAFALHSTAENAQEKSTATDNDRHPRKTKSEPGTPTFSVAFSLLALSQLFRPCPFWIAFATTPSATRELLRARKNYRPIAEVARMLLGVAYELLSPVILILYSFSPPRGTTELDLGGQRSRLDVHEDGVASLAILYVQSMLACHP